LSLCKQICADDNVKFIKRITIIASWFEDVQSLARPKLDVCGRWSAMVGHQTRREKCSHGLVSSAREEHVSGTSGVSTQTQAIQICTSRQMKLSV